MKNKVFLAIMIIMVMFKLSVAQTYQWAHGIGSASTTVEEGNSVVTDPSGNVFICGEFRGLADFDPGTSTYTMMPIGTSDAFLAKYSANGSFQWAFHMGSAGVLARAINVTTDASGNVYVTGVYRGTIDIDPGPAAVTLTASTTTYDIFLAKYTPSGTLAWGFKLGANSDDTAGDVIIDNAGNVVLTGYYQNSMDVDPGLAVVTLTNAGGYDSFLAKFNSSNGNFISAWRWGGNGSDRCFSVREDASNNLIATGRFTGTVNMNPAGTATTITAGAEDGYVVKFSSAGTYSWHATFGSLAANEECTALAIDPSENIYLTGNFQNTVDFDPSASTTTLTSSGGNDAYIAKFNGAGALQWVFALGAIGADVGYDLSIMNNELHACGTFSSNVDFDPSVTATFTLASAGNTDMYLARYTLNGAFVNAIAVGGANSDTPKSVATASNTVYLTGSFNSTVDFNPDPVLTNTLVSNGATDIFIAKYYNCSPGTPSVSIAGGSVCAGQSFTLNPTGALNYTFTGGGPVVTPTVTSTYTVIGFDSNNCSDVKTATVTVNPLPTLSVSTTSTLLCVGNSATIAASGANTYTWNPVLPMNGVISPTVNTSYTVTGTDMAGCSNSAVFTQSVSACTSVNELHVQNIGLMVFPNPGKDVIHLKVSSGGNIMLLNMLGRVLYSDIATETEKSIDSSNFPSGVYFIQFTKGHETQTVKWIKN